jgi:hypothetical protein
MTRKQWLLLVFAIALTGLSLYLNKDWFAGDNIQIFHRSRPARVGLFSRRRSKPAADTSNIDPLLFGFDRKVKLTSVKIISVAEALTNKYPHALWHLVSESNSIPTKEFSYGITIKGMHPAIKGAQPDPLEPGENYRLCIETATFKGEHDFKPVPKTP